MSKYSNHIYLIICEESLKHFKKSKFLTYRNYVKNIGDAFNNDSLTRQHSKDITNIIDVLDKIFTMSSEDTGNYIFDYFNMPTEEIIKYEKSVKLTEALFPDINKTT
tara:strand:- start:301 stop:621 length:321 start_codon:yes stop_codon:yes gene_type:complete